MKGHWTCCMNEDKDGTCSTHNGFWHAKCKDSLCTDNMCGCLNCSHLCEYVGWKDHWSCCKSDNLFSECVNSVYKA